MQQPWFFFLLFFLNRHQLSSPHQCPWRRPCWRWLSRRDTWSAPATVAHKDGEAPEDKTVVIRLRRRTRCEVMSERSTASGGHYLSATAAAMGTRILPRAVAASSSISVFNRLMTHSMASRPWGRQTGRASKQRNGTDGLLWVFTALLKSGHLIPAGYADICITLLALTEMVFAISPSR